jgi:iron(III) transport system substrate-binding protein
MQVQSSADPPKKLALGERAIMADGNEYNLIQLKEKGSRSRSSIRARARR